MNKELLSQTLNNAYDHIQHGAYNDALSSICEAQKELENPEFEPVAYMMPSDLERFKTEETFANAYSVAIANPREESVPLYTSPPQQNPLSDDKIKAIAIEHFGSQLDGNDFMFARSIEKAHGIGK